MPAPASSGSSLRLRVLVCVAVSYCTLVAALSGPGFASFDTAYQWWMARHATVSSLWPPSYVVTFGWFDVFSPYIYAPTVWFSINLTLVSAASVVVAYFCGRTVIGAVAVFLALAASPVSWLLLPHIWSDVALVAVLLFSVACLLASVVCDANKRARTALLCVSLICLFAAVGIRHNAVLAVLPLATLWCITSLRPFKARNSGTRRVALAVLGASLMTCIFVVVHTGLSHVLATERSDTWAITAIWDLQAMSIASDQVLIPTLISPNTDLADLRASYDPSNAVALYTRSKATWANATTGLSAQQSTALATAWWKAVRAAPFAYLAHRSGVIALMLGIEKRDTSTASPIAASTRVEPVQVSFRDNPTRAFWWDGGVNGWRRIAGYITNSQWGTPIGTLMMSLLTVAIALPQRALRRRRNVGADCEKSGTSCATERMSRHQPALVPDTWPHAAACLASGALYFAGLFIAVPTADMRYAFWLVVAAVLTAVFICTMRSPAAAVGESAAGVTSPVS